MFSKFELTNKGVELLNRVIAEQKTLKFTKFQIGKGDFSGDKKTLTQLVSKIDEFNVSQTNVLADGITNIKGFYDNRNLSVASKLTEIGIMAQLGNDSLTEVLFSYSNQPSADAETIPSKESYFSRTFSVMNRTDNVTSVTFNLTIRQDKYNFGTLAEMKAADYLDIGDKVTLWGNAALGDSSFKMYVITDQSQPIQLNNKLYAKEYFKIVNDLTTGGADKAGSAEMVKKLNDEKLNRGIYNGDAQDLKNGIDKSLSPKEPPSSFDGTFGDFIKKFSNSGIYSISKELGYFENFGFQWGTYEYGVLVVQYTNGNYLRLEYYPDEFYGQNSYIMATTIVQFNKASSEWQSKTFKTDVKWARQLTDKSDIFLGNCGMDYVTFIQIKVTKYRGKGYFDKDTGKLYICSPKDPTVNSVEDVTVTENFRLATNIDLANNTFEVISLQSNQVFTQQEYPFECTLLLTKNSFIIFGMVGGGTYYKVSPTFLSSYGLTIQSMTGNVDVPSNNVTQQNLVVGRVNGEFWVEGQVRAINFIIVGTRS